jgi:hypothetical protein
MWLRNYYFHKVLIQPKSKGMQACMYKLRLLSSCPMRTSWSLSWAEALPFLTYTVMSWQLQHMFVE